MQSYIDLARPSERYLLQRRANITSKRNRARAQEAVWWGEDGRTRACATFRKLRDPLERVKLSSAPKRYKTDFNKEGALPSGCCDGKLHLQGTTTPSVDKYGKEKV